MKRIVREFRSTNAALLRGGRVVALLAEVSGRTEGGAPAMRGRLLGRRSFWVAPGSRLVFAWQVRPEQANSAWLEADVVVESVEGDAVAVRGAGSCRPSRDPRHS